MLHPNKVKHVIVIFPKTCSNPFAQALVSMAESLSWLPLIMIKKKNVDTF